MFKRHAPGQRLNAIPARAMNGLYELLEERTRRGADILRGDSAEIMVKNNTGDVLQMFDLVAVGDVLHTPTINEHEYRGVNIFEGNTPTAASLIAVVQEPLSDGAIGRAIVQGVTACRLNVTDSADTHAAPTTSVTQLTTGTSGPALILWKESGTGTGKKAKVLLLGAEASGGGSGGGSLVYDHWVLDAELASTAKNTDTAVTGWTSSLGSNTDLQFPSTGIWKLDFTFCSLAYGDAAMDLTLGVRIAGVATKGTVITPGTGDNNVLLNHMYSTSDAGIIQTTSFSMLVDIDAAEEDAIEVYASAQTSSGSGVNWAIYDKLTLTNDGDNYCTWIVGHKVG